MANTYYIDNIKYADTYNLLDSGATHDSTTHKLSGTTGDFKVDGDFFANNGVFNYIKAVDADISNLSVDDLKAERATVAIRLDVEGELHTNSWTASNISTIDGAFYITPTISCESGTFNYDGTSITVTAASGYSFGIDDLYMNGLDNGNGLTSTWWTRYSYVILTGDILDSTNNEWKPLGTIRGRINSNPATTSSIQINSLTDNKGNSTILTLNDIGTGNKTFRNIKISLYKRATSSTVDYPIGIYMTALATKGKTFLDIYGGNEQTGQNVTNTINNVTHNSGALAKPKVRIGNLLGLPKVGGIDPTGWGIYTNNGFFEGTIVANQGKIGGINGWTIGSDSNNNRAYIFSGITNITTSGSTTGTYVGTNGISNYKNTTQYVNLTDGKITAQGADIAGKITATSGAIGGWTIEDISNNTYGGAIYTGTFGQDGGIFITPSYLSSTEIAGSHYLPPGTAVFSGIYDKYWVFTAGNKFGVTKYGQLYASYGLIGGFEIGSQDLTAYNSSGGAIQISKDPTVDAFSCNYYYHSGINPSATRAYFRVTQDGKLYANSAEISGNITATDGFTVTQNGTTLASMTGSGIQLGSSGVTNASHIALDYHSLQLIDKEGNTYVHFSDLRDNNGQYTFTDTWTGDGATRNFSLTIEAANTSYTVKVNNTAVTSGITKTTTTLYFSTAPSSGDVITAIYLTESSELKAFTLGTRADGSDTGVYSFALGEKITASGYLAHAEGYQTIASGIVSYAEGSNTTASNTAAHAEGVSTTASGYLGSHAEGNRTTASGSWASHAEGFETTASGPWGSHAEGESTTASGSSSHAEGESTTASGNRSHAEGYNTSALASCSHAEGIGSVAGSASVGEASHAQNSYTIALGPAQTAIGRYNVGDAVSAFIIGNGSDSSRSNALTVDWSGNVDIASGAKYKINGTALSAADVGAVPTSRKVNNKALSSDISLTASDVGAVPATGGTFSGIVYHSDSIVFNNNVGVRLRKSGTTSTGTMALFMDTSDVMQFGTSGTTCNFRAAVTMASGATVTGNLLNSNGGTLGSKTKPFGALYTSAALHKTGIPGSNTQAYAACWFKSADDDYFLCRPSSSRKVKKDIEAISDEFLDPHKLYDLRVVQFRYKTSNKDDPNNSKHNPTAIVPGFIAEEVAEIYPAGGVINDVDEIDDWDLRTMVPPMLALIQEQHKEIEQLKKEVQELKNK